ncbi:MULTISPECIES: PTS transporter subunit EIIB [Trueperella]|uniref:Glucose-like phosphotransferase system IIB component n=1 Tax=Trueperella abortisuis TaxID=445930 RepID=A0ABT9PJF8_9ACTO|nr:MULTISPECIES: PTS transporter subunit EIIB [Trueperella]MCI7304782.1 PTS transporter subunit EIIB [Trueperella sp.]MDP9832856.1 glucose-like phosphotransferase system IIB component [Trueperella abortisuis]MDY5404321.1 PTS transporter subunit EIIB [Trueperella sp.]
MDLEELLAAVGGAKNVRKVDVALARIRVGVVDKNLVDKPRLERMGALGVVVQKRAVQLIIGPEAEQVGVELDRRLFGEPEE